MEQKQNEYKQCLLRITMLEEKKTNLTLLHSGKLYTSTEIAKELGMSARKLNNSLCEMKVQYKVNGTWVLHAKYQDKKFVSEKQDILDNGKVIYNRKWTEEGRRFILNLLNK